MSGNKETTKKHSIRKSTRILLASLCLMILCSVVNWGDCDRLGKCADHAAFAGRRRWHALFGSDVCAEECDE